MFTGETTEASKDSESETESPAAQNTSHNKLNVAQLAILVFYNVSGGPFGIEPTLRAAGNLWAIVGFTLGPLLWSLPESLITAELGSIFTSNSGGVIWVQTAFGDLAGAYCGYFNWVSGATDNAIYPGLFLSYLLGPKSHTMDAMERFGCVSAISIILASFNYLGLEIVGNANILICIISMSPFVIMIILGAAQVDPHKWFQLPEQNSSASDLFDDDVQTSPGPLPLTVCGVFMRPFLNNLFWNLNSFDSAANFVEEVQDVRTTYPRGIFIGLFLSVVSYLLPLLVIVGATDYSQKEWVDGHIAAAATQIGGRWLGQWTVFAVGISNLGLFVAELSSDAYQLMGMAEQGYLPNIFKYRSRFNTPTAGIALGTCVIVAMGFADFEQLVELLNANYAIALLFEFAAFVKLRWCRKDLHRPYRVPISDGASIFLVAIPCTGIIVLFTVSSWTTYLFVAGVFVFCSVLIATQRIAKDWGCCGFDNNLDGHLDEWDREWLETQAEAGQTGKREDEDEDEDSFVLNEDVQLVPSSLRPTRDKTANKVHCRYETVRIV